MYIPRDDGTEQGIDKLTTKQFYSTLCVCVLIAVGVFLISIPIVNGMIKLKLSMVS